MRLVQILDLEQAVLLVNLGVVYERLGAYAIARERLEAGLAQAQIANDLETQANALSTLSWIAVNQGDRNQAWSLAAKALVLAQRVRNRNVEALALRRLGIIAHYQRNDTTAVRYYEKSLALYREAGDRSGIASCLNNLGEISRKRGDYQVAARYYEESLEIFSQIGSRRGAAICLNNLGYIAISLDDERAARRYFRAALTEAMTIGVSPIVLDTLIGKAELLAKMGERIQAAELLGLALNHPMCDNEARLSAQPVLTALRAMLLPDELEAALEHGKTHKLEETIESQQE